MKMVSGFGPEPSCVLYEGADLAEQLMKPLQTFTVRHGWRSEDELTEEIIYSRRSDR